MLDRTTDGSVATLVLNRPDARNALSPELLSALIAQCEALASDESVHVVLIRGARGVFSGGADLLAFAPMLATGERSAADLGRRATDAMAGLPQVTVAYVEGPCVGGGMVLAGACDLRLAGPGARFWAPEVEAGIPVAWGGMAVLHRLVGEACLVDLVLGGRRLDADEAKAAGFVSEIVDVADALDRVGRLASVPASTLRAVKRQLQGLRRGTFDADQDAVDLLAAMRDPAVVDGMQAYLVKRLRKG